MANRTSNRKNKGHKTPSKKFKESSVAGIEKSSSEVKKLNNNNELK